MFRRRKRSFEDFQAEIESHLGLEADEIRATVPGADFDAAARRDAGETIELAAVERLRVVDGARHAVAELVDTVRQDGDAAPAGVFETSEYPRISAAG